MRLLTIAPTFEAWQDAARKILREGVEPAAVAWEDLLGEEPALALFEKADGIVRAGKGKFRVPKGFLEIGRRVACHRDARRRALVYRALWRLTHGERRLLEIVVDPDIDELMRMDKAVRHDVHKMRAFVRFRTVSHEGGSRPPADHHDSLPPPRWYVAWFEPEHHIVEMNAPFFRDRFAAMRWSILTPERCVHWGGARLSYSDGVAISRTTRSRRCG